MESNHRSAFGSDKFGQIAERFARFFGTPTYIIGQTIIVIIWIAINGLWITHTGWDPFPFILLNLVFSTQAAYAAPLILLAQTRQADRDAISAKEHEEDRERIASKQQQELDVNTKLTEEVHKLAKEIHAQVGAKEPSK